MTTREYLRPIVERVAREVVERVEADDSERLRRELNRALRDAYPGTARRGAFYQVWRDECRRAMRRLGLVEGPRLGAPLFEQEVGGR